MLFRYQRDKKKLSWVLKSSLTFFCLICDRFLKFLAVNDFLNNKKIIGDFFKFNFASNYNIAFSLPITGWCLNVLIILIIFVLIFYLLYLFKKQDSKKFSLLLLIICGAVSNLFDRFKYGYVIDYFDLKYFTVFNLADVMIVGGVIGLGWLIVKGNKKHQLQR